jgi:sugar/nucleoside kinase (ribokinase family)
VSVDVACVGPVFLDLTFSGLEEIPRPGQERFSSELHVTAGGMANVAIGLSRLGLSTALVTAVGRDVAGEYLRRVLAGDGIDVRGPEPERTPVTAILPAAGDRAMATFDPHVKLSREDVAALGPRAIVANVAYAHLAGNGETLYALVGDADADADGAGLPRGSERADVLFANADEAKRLAGAGDAGEAARRLATRFRSVIVTLGSRGAIGIEDGCDPVQVAAPPVAVLDTTGAGDLFAASYVWADLLSLPLEQRLRWAVLYASLSVGEATAQDGAFSRAALERAAAHAGLVLPDTLQPTVPEDSR